MLRNEFIQEYQDYILKTVRNIVKREIDESSDEFSIGLIAFDEAIQSYKFETPFKSFSSMVIKRRVIDFLRKEQTDDMIVSSYGDEDGDDERDKSISYSNYILQSQNEDRKEEIRNFTLKLSEFGIKFTDLAKDVPRHIDAKRKAIMIAQLIANDEDLRSLMYEKNKLPLKELLEKVDVSKKTLERNRKFIIAMTIISIENYKHLTEFLKT